VPADYPLVPQWVSSIGRYPNSSHNKAKRKPSGGRRLVSAYSRVQLPECDRCHRYQSSKNISRPQSSIDRSRSRSRTKSPYYTERSVVNSSQAKSVEPVDKTPKSNVRVRARPLSSKLARQKEMSKGDMKSTIKNYINCYSTAYEIYKQNPKI